MSVARFGKTWIRSGTDTVYRGLGVGLSQIALLDCDFSPYQRVPEDVELRFSAKYSGSVSPSPVDDWGLRLRILHSVGSTQGTILADLRNGASIVVPAGRISVQAYQVRAQKFFVEEITATAAVHSGGSTQASLTYLDQDVSYETNTMNGMAVQYTVAIPERARRVALGGLMSGFVGRNYFVMAQRHTDYNGVYIGFHNSAEHPELLSSGVQLFPTATKITVWAPTAVATHAKCCFFLE